MKSISIAAFLIFQAWLLHGQAVRGKVLDAANGRPLEYVSIGVINTTIGTITDERGDFTLTLKNCSDQDQVRISMIGYEPRTFAVKAFIDYSQPIKLKQAAIELKEVVIRPSGRIKKAGTPSYTWHGGLCGWGGTDFGKGYEIGTEIRLGNLPVRIISLNLRLSKQSFDSSFFRLHIREIRDSLPGRELLTTNVIFPVTAESGWVKVGLERYNIVLRGTVAVLIEWVKVKGVNSQRLIKMNGSKDPSANVLFNMKRNNGITITRWGTEAKWIRHAKGSPAFYLVVGEGVIE